MKGRVLLVCLGDVQHILAEKTVSGRGGEADLKGGNSSRVKGSVLNDKI